MNSYRVDAEANDPIKSTEAAARYLKDLYLIFESWYLAASGYNAGEYKILRAIENLKTNNFWRISESKQIRRETKDYIPKLIAAAIIAKNPARYGFEEVAYDEPLEFDTITIDFAVNLKDIAKSVDSSEDELLDLNPELRRNMVPPHIATYELRVPAGSKTLVERAIQSIRTKFAKDEMPAQYFAKHGDTLNSVANKFHLRKKDLANANNLSPREKLSPGQELIIPNKKFAESSKKTIARVHKETSLSDEDAKGFIIHIVRKGESLWSISEKYNVTVQELYKWNKLSNRKILPGNRIRVKSENTAPEV
jgi:membrane-bound lytic murein transglycosylase D